MLSKQHKKTTKKACEKYQNLSKEEKEKKRQYCRLLTDIKNVSEDEKQRQVGHRKKIYKMRKYFHLETRQLISRKSL